MIKKALTTILITLIAAGCCWADEPVQKLPPRRVSIDVEYAFPSLQPVGAANFEPALPDIDLTLANTHTTEHQSKRNFTLQDCDAASNGGAGALLASAARCYLGKIYRRGGTGKDGVDCSGLVWAALKQVFGEDIIKKLKMPRGARDMYRKFGITIKNMRDLQPGDLLFFMGGRHVGIYLGPNEETGEEEVIQASSSKRQVVVTPLNNMPPVSGIKRIFPN